MKSKYLRILLTSDFINVYGFGLFSPLFALYAIHVGGTAEQAAFIWSAYNLLSGISTILFGRIENRYKLREKIVLTGSLLQVVATALLFAFNDLTWLIISLCMYAVGIGICAPAWKALYAHYEDKGKETQEWGLLDGGNNLFFSLAAASAGIILNFYGFRGILLGMFLAHTVGAILISRLLITRRPG